MAIKKTKAGMLSKDLDKLDDNTLLVMDINADDIEKLNKEYGEVINRPDVQHIKKSLEKNKY